MAKKDSEEPTMEEILASIRRIIAEEGDDAKPVAATPPAEAAAEADILELTEVVQDIPAGDLAEGPLELDEQAGEVDLAAHAFAENDAETYQESVDEELSESLDDGENDPNASPSFSEELAPPGAELAGDDDIALADAVDPAEMKDAIMSEQFANQVSDSFARLSDLLVAGYAGSDKTLEGMVREMLKPMLKEWLDQNLHGVVERVVAREVARLARTKRP